jgi:hypothetical protein
MEYAAVITVEKAAAAKVFFECHYKTSSPVMSRLGLYVVVSLKVLFMKMSSRLLLKRRHSAGPGLVGKLITCARSVR